MATSKNNIDGVDGWVNSVLATARDIATDGPASRFRLNVYRMWAVLGSAPSRVKRSAIQVSEADVRARVEALGPNSVAAARKVIRELGKAGPTLTEQIALVLALSRQCDQEAYEHPSMATFAHDEMACEATLSDGRCAFVIPFPARRQNGSLRGLSQRLPLFTRGIIHHRVSGCSLRRPIESRDNRLRPKK